MTVGKYTISRKQEFFLGLLVDPTVNELLIGGAAGGAKTVSMCLGIITLVKEYPGVRLFVGRKTLKSLKQSTINTLINKVHPMVGIAPDKYALHLQDMTLDYSNGSKIIFGELGTIPSDEDFARIGSLEIDAAFVDEAGEITLKAKNAIKSRIGRGVMAEEYGMPGKLILSCNPSLNFLRQEYYDPYIQLGGGDYKEWRIGDIEVGDRPLPNYRAFLKMDAYDNPFLPKTYIDNLKTLPDRERKRLLEGNWDYADEESSLFKTSLLDKATAFEIPKGESDKFDKFIGVDVADLGKDHTVFSLIENGILTTQKVSAVQMNWDKESKLPMGRLLADELIELAQRNGFTPLTASHIAVETNGVGASIRDFLRDRGWQITEYTATHKSRSENYYQLMLDMDSGSVKMLYELNGLDALKRQLTVHTYQMNNQVPDVLKKEKIKQVLGKSPDEADSFCIANFCRNWITNPANDPSRNANRILY